MDVNAIYVGDKNTKYKKSLQLEAVDNLKRVVFSKYDDWSNHVVENPYSIANFMEAKTTWHPIEAISGSGSGY